jgi:hypothetical protein
MIEYWSLLVGDYARSVALGPMKPKDLSELGLLRDELSLVAEARRRAAKLVE